MSLICGTFAAPRVNMFKQSLLELRQVAETAQDLGQHIEPVPPPHESYS
jgi:hypothetical protein